MLNLNDPKQLEAYQQCLNKIKIGDEVEFFLKIKKKNETPSSIFGYDFTDFSNKTQYILTDQPSDIFRKFTVIYLMTRRLVNKTTNKLITEPVIASPDHDIKQFSSLGWYIPREVLFEYKNGKYFGWTGFMLKARKTEFAPINIYRRSSLI